MIFKSHFFLSLKKIKNSEFSFAITTTGIATIMQLLVGLVINKIIAVKIGPSGIAILGQFANFRDLLTTAATGSFSQGVTKYVADPEYNEKEVISTSSLFSIISSAVISIIVISFAEFITHSLFGSQDYKFVIYILGTTLTFFALNNLLLAIINGKRKYSLLIRVKLTNSIIALIFSGLLCWFYELNGALTALALNTTIVFFISLFIIFYAKEKYFKISRDSWSTPILKKLLGFTLMALTSAALGPITQLYIRSYIIDQGSSFDAGIWESIKKLSSYYNQLITMPLSVYYLPKLSSLKTNLQLKNEIHKGIKLVIPIFVLMALGIFLSRNWIIELLFSAEFSSMEKLFLPQLTGDFFMIFSYMISNMLLAKAMVKTFMITQVVMTSTNVSLSIFFFRSLGIEGVIWANALNYLIYLIIMITIFRKILFIK